MQSGVYKTWVQTGADDVNERGKEKASKIVIEKDGQILSFYISNGRLEKKGLKLIDREIDKLSVGRRRIPEIESLALNTLKEAGLHTIAAITIRDNNLTRANIIEVTYPTVFMNLEASITPSRRNEAGAAMAAYFLKLVPSIKI